VIQIIVYQINWTRISHNASAGSLPVSPGMMTNPGPREVPCPNGCRMLSPPTEQVHVFVPSDKTSRVLLYQGREAMAQESS